MRYNMWRSTRFSFLNLIYATLFVANVPLMASGVMMSGGKWSASVLKSILTTAAQVVIVVGGVVMGVLAIDAWTLQPIRDDIGAAIKEAVQRDEAVKVEVRAEVNEKLMEALRDGQASLERLRSSLVSELRGQTAQLSKDIGSLRGTITRVEDRQSYMMRYIFGRMPTDNEVQQSGALPGTSLLPVWLVEQGDLSKVKGALGAKGGATFKLQLTPASGE